MISEIGISTDIQNLDHFEIPSVLAQSDGLQHPIMPAPPSDASPEVAGSTTASPAKGSIVIAKLKQASLLWCYGFKEACCLHKVVLSCSRFDLYLFFFVSMGLNFPLKFVFFALCNQFSRILQVKKPFDSN